MTVAAVLHDFIDAEALPGTGVEPDAFWAGFAALSRSRAAQQAPCSQRRDALQAEIDAWHRAHPAAARSGVATKPSCARSAICCPSRPQFTVDHANVDAEIASIAGPQLVVPVTNARYALNAANARWGSLYDALYGTDAIPEDGGAARGGGYNPVRGARVVAGRAKVLDETSRRSPTAAIADATGYAIVDGRLVVTR